MQECTPHIMKVKQAGKPINADYSALTEKKKKKKEFRQILKLLGSKLMIESEWNSSREIFIICFEN